MQPATPQRRPDVEELASRRAVLAGFVEPASMPRLMEVATKPPPAVAYRIEFTRDARGRPRMSGHVEGTWPLVCQRCLGDLDWRFDVKFETLVLGSEGDGTIEQDVVVCPGARIPLEPVIEDELLLALPNAPVHPNGACEAPPIRAGADRAGSGRAADGEGPERRSNPFSVLRTLRPDQGADRSESI